MNSSRVRITALIATLSILIDLGCEAVTVSTGVNEKSRVISEGIFGRLQDEIEKPEKLEKERHKATLRKKQ